MSDRYLAAQMADDRVRRDNRAAWDREHTPQPRKVSLSQQDRERVETAKSGIRVALGLIRETEAYREGDMDTEVAPWAAHHAIHHLLDALDRLTSMEEA